MWQFLEYLISIIYGKNRIPKCSESEQESSAIPAWAKYEVASSVSAQRISPEHTQEVFSWSDVKEIVGVLDIPIYPSKHQRPSFLVILAWFPDMGPADVPESDHCAVFTFLANYGLARSHTDLESANNRLDVIRRQPSKRVVYKTWCKDTIAKHGSITAYMCSERLHWTPLASSNAESGPLFSVADPVPFQNPNDYRILRNDWPYGSFDDSITHLIVWSKPRIGVDPETGLVTAESRQLIDAFVNKTFVKRLEQEDPEVVNIMGERVLWFKNWAALQSVRGLEHIHVLVKDVDDSIVEKWTGEKAPQK